MNKSGSVIAAVAGIAVLSGFGFTHHHTATATHTASAVTRTVTRTVHQVSHTPKATAARPATDPSLAWLASAGGQAQVTLSNQVATLAADLQTENGSPTVANHLIFEADARAVRAQAQKILRPPASRQPRPGHAVCRCRPGARHDRARRTTPSQRRHHRPDHPPAMTPESLAGEAAQPGTVSADGEPDPGKDAAPGRRGVNPSPDATGGSGGSLSSSRAARN